jgi:hypothetical protein
MTRDNDLSCSATLKHCAAAGTAVGMQFTAAEDVGGWARRAIEGIIRFRSTNIAEMKISSRTLVSMPFYRKLNINACRPRRHTAARLSSRNGALAHDW